MIKLIEDIFFTEIIAHNAFSQGSDLNPEDIYCRYENGNLELRNAVDESAGEDKLRFETYNSSCKDSANKPNGESSVRENIKDEYYR
ncbi:MAG: hypothetical protein WC139_10525 [Candidatus Kapaibacterium sp.]